MQSQAFYRELGKMLKGYRQSVSLSQQDIADRLKVSRSTVGSWEQGRRVIYADDFFKYCDVVNADPNEITDQARRYLYK